MNIAFDLDRIFIDTPPFVPDWIINKFYKEKDNGELLYRIPGPFEQKIRRLSHARYLRPAIRKNIQILTRLNKAKKHAIFLISGRFGFLQAQTEKVMKCYGLSSLFKKTYFNLHNEQPHEFKNRMIREKKIDVFVDDDLSLLKYLSYRNADKTFYWLNDHVHATIGKNLHGITQLQQLMPYADK